MNFVLLQLLKFLALVFCIVLCTYCFKTYLKLEKKRLRFLYDIAVTFVIFSILIFFKVNFT